MPLSPHPMIAFIHMFKTGGTTITGILRRNFSVHHFDTRLIQDKPAITADQLRRAQRIYPRIDSLAGHAVRTTSDLRQGFPDLRFYTFMRKPQPRLLSAYIFARSTQMKRGHWKPGTPLEIEADFQKFLTEFTQAYTSILGADAARPDIAIEALERDVGFVGLVEAFDESLAMFTKWLGRPGFDPGYRRLNVAARRSEDGTATDIAAFAELARSVAAKPRVASLIEEFCAPDDIVYRHILATIWPRQKERYAAGPGPFKFEREHAASDTIANRMYRDLIGRPFVKLVAGPVR